MAYVKAPLSARNSWRLTVPGGPPGGQYHGYLGFAPGVAVNPNHTPGDSLDEWERWAGSGSELWEGEANSDYVYRSSAEMRPRANASGGQNVTENEAEEITAGFAEGPGSYAALGAFVSQLQPPLRAIAAQRSVVATPPGSDWPTYQLPNRQPNVPGATSITPQPPPPGSSWPVNTVRNWQPEGPQGSPSPAPTVPAYAEDYQPGQGQPLFSISPTTAALAPGETQQFAASVPVTWSAIYGTITGTGLYTAPTGSSALTDTITATALNQNPSNRQGRAGLYASSGDSLSATVTILQAATLEAVQAAAAAATPAGTLVAPTVDFSAWLSASTIFPGIANEWVLAGGLGAVLLFFMMGKRR